MCAQASGCDVVLVETVGGGQADVLLRSLMLPCSLHPPTHPSVSPCPLPLSQASGCDVLLVETVGGGQADVAVAQITDMVLLLLPPAGGDELQGIKKGVVEIADLVVVNKADGAMEGAALAAVGEYSNALHFVHPRYDFWMTPVVACSTRTGLGIEDVWKKIGKFQEAMRSSGELQQLRGAQNKALLWSTVEAEILYKFRSGGKLQGLMRYFEEHAMSGDIAARAAAVTVVDSIFSDSK
ncbi:unnamed protein product [Closterium sp. NIES-54]